MSNQNTTQIPKQPVPGLPEENILVVPRACLFSDGDWNGFKKAEFDTYTALISQHKQFLPRAQMEVDPTYKQIIPYLIFTHNGQYFLMQRHAKASEQRLKGKLSLGIGGHIRQEDMGSGSIIDWAQREFHEEVAYRGNVTVKPLGLINDDSTEVGRVHIGFAFLLQGDSEQIAVKSELQSGVLASYDECVAQRERMETWSRIVLDFLFV